MDEKSGKETVSLLHILSPVPLLTSSSERHEKNGKESEKKDEQEKKGKWQRDSVLSVPRSLFLSLFSFPPGRSTWSHASSTFSIPCPSFFLSGWRKKRNEQSGKEDFSLLVLYQSYDNITSVSY